MPEHLVPHWLAWPAGTLAVLGAIAGCGLMFAAVAFGEYALVAWSVGTFFVASIFWYLGDMAADNRPL